MQNKKKIITAGAMAGCVISAPILLHQPQAQPEASTQGWKTTAAYVTADLVGQQLQQDPEAIDATGVLCVPQPDQAMPATAFNCAITYQDGTGAVYSVTIPPNWQAGQQPFSDISLIKFT